MSDDPMFSAALNYALERILKGAGSLCIYHLLTQGRVRAATDDRFQENGML